MCSSDLGIAAALLIRLAVYVKGKNARKFRKNIEYGSARWGNSEDIKPYTCLLYTSNRSFGASAEDCGAQLTFQSRSTRV